MTPESLQQLLAQTDTNHRADQPRNRFIQGLETYTEERQLYYFWFKDSDEFTSFVELLDIDTVDGDAVLETVYRNTARAGLERSDDTQYEGPWQLRGLFNAIADRGAPYVEFVNNYQALATITLDEESVVTIGMELDEQPGICDPCYEDEEYMEHNEDFNCGHGVKDEYHEKFLAVIYDRSQIPEIRPEDGHLF